MATQPKIRPPFAWLGQYTPAASVIGTVAIGAFFRFFELGSLPPGLDAGTATVGLQALALLNSKTLPGLGVDNGYAPLWVWLQASSIKVFGHTALALRIWPAILGTLAILVAWLWVRSWFNLRLAWLTAFLLAVTPWAVTLSRSGSEAALWPFMVSLTLWIATLAWRRPGIKYSVLLAVVLTLNLLSGPIGWLITFSTVITGAVFLARQKKLFVTDRPRIIGVALLAAGLAFFGYLVGLSYTAVKSLPSAAGLVSSAGAFGSSLLHTLLMFNVSGDQNYRHNLAGEPLLNAFVGLMLVAGILVGVSRFHERRYRLLFAFLIILLLPAVISTIGSPNAARAACALPVVLAFAAVGISYMLELWYQTFPINSAARTTGQAAIFVLLALTFFQGYTQYFHAWAGSSAVYIAYNEGAVQMAEYLSTNGFTGARYVVAPADQLPIVAYLEYHGAAYTPIEPAALLGLPANAGARQFIIAADSRNDAVKSLKVKFPGGVLVPHYSTFNQAEIYYSYEVTK